MLAGPEVTALLKLGLPILAAAFLAWSPQLEADVVSTADLLGANEVPSNASPATGTATLTLSGDSLHVDISFLDLVSPAFAAHIHCCTPPGTNTLVAVPFPSFPAATSGTYANTFDLTMTAVYTSGFLSAHGGTAAGAEAALIAGLNAGDAYVNIHDAVFPGGEIRGFAEQLVPEPRYAGLLGLGLIALIFSRRFRLV